MKKLNASVLRYRDEIFDLDYLPDIYVNSYTEHFAKKNLQP